jgi:signal peptidase I
VPIKENDLDRPAGVGSERAAVRVRHLWLFRDTYFTTARDGSPTSADVPEFRPDDPGTWRHLEDAPASAYRVGTGHYFTLGDNSAESSDSRSWGPVPSGKVLGRVLLRYHPPARMGRID